MATTFIFGNNIIHSFEQSFHLQTSLQIIESDPGEIVFST